MPASNTNSYAQPGKSSTVIEDAVLGPAGPASRSTSPEPESSGSETRRPTRLRILHVVPQLGVGGTEKGILKVIHGLGHERFEHRLCAVRLVDADFTKTIDKETKVCSAGTGAPGMQFPLFRLSRLMREFRPHIVHSRNFGALEAVPAARFARVPIVVHSEHGYELEILKGLPLRRRLLRRALFPMVDAWFAVTEDLRDYHAREAWIPAKELRVLYNGVDTNCFAPRPAQGAQVRHQFGISADRILLGSVGRLVPIKDHRTLLRAAEMLIEQGRNVHVLLVGDGPERARLQSQAEGSAALNGRVTLAGAAEDIPALLNAVDIFVLPSTSEGMSNTVLEAMATGLSVVATRAGGNPEVIEDGRSGLLFPAGDAGRLRELLSGLVDDPDLRRAIGAAARERAVRKFSFSMMLESYRDLYERLAECKGVWRN